MDEFLDEFKRLEKLCNEIYDQQHGVTLYIDEMEQRSSVASKVIYDWDNDLRKLKRVRHIRNNLVHEPGYLGDYDWSDIAFMKEFCHRILDQQDPLVSLRRLTQRIAQNRRRSCWEATHQSSSLPRQHEQTKQTKPSSNDAKRTQRPSSHGSRWKGNSGRILIKTFLIGLAALLIRLLWFFAKLISETPQ
ncbi:MAG: hypothetical protein IK026_00840 [Eubacteriaceae bacterium]|nr:hypothetical protein [Eubacteriaceae bacterium]